jgi:hypothetical protein
MDDFETAEDSKMPFKIGQSLFTNYKHKDSLLTLVDLGGAKRLRQGHESTRKYLNQRYM